MISLQDLENYSNQLLNFDWYYEYSDDGNVWRAGQQKYAELCAIVKLDPMYQRAFDTVQQGIRDRVLRADIQKQLNELKAEFLIAA